MNEALRLNSITKERLLLALLDKFSDRARWTHQDIVEMVDATFWPDLQRIEADVANATNDSDLRHAVGNRTQFLAAAGIVENSA